MTDKLDRIAELVEQIATTNNVDTDTHTEHHEFIQALIEREHRKTELWEKVKAQVAGSLILMTIGGILTAVYQVFFKNG